MKDTHCTGTMGFRRPIQFPFEGQALYKVQRVSLLYSPPSFNANRLIELGPVRIRLFNQRTALGLQSLISFVSCRGWTSP